jgi:dihydropteroate synthase
VHSVVADRAVAGVTRPLVMGVLNVTPDSFFDGGRHADAASAVAWGRRMIHDGADVIDVGGESSRPGAQPVAPDEELRRVLPVVGALAGEARLSIDTMKPEVAEAALAEGATLVNDVACRCADVAAAAGAGIIVMHMRGSPPTMQVDPRYEDVAGEVATYLAGAAAQARAAGVGEVYVDPGIGFGKTVAHNLALLAALPELVAAGEPVVVGASRKGFLGRLSAPRGEPPLRPDERLEASLALATWAMAAGAAMVRVHDVRATVQAAILVGS